MQILNFCRGKYGSVKLAIHKGSGDQHAIKIVSKKGGQIALKGLFREIEIMRSVDHPLIVNLREVYEDPSNYYLVMEL
jgi:serine/threonine protein kinase